MQPSGHISLVGLPTRSEQGLQLQHQVVRVIRPVALREADTVRAGEDLTARPEVEVRRVESVQPASGQELCRQPTRRRTSWQPSCIAQSSTKQSPPHAIHHHTWPAGR